MNRLLIFVLALSILGLSSCTKKESVVVSKIENKTGSIIFDTSSFGFEGVKTPNNNTNTGGSSTNGNTNNSTNIGNTTNINKPNIADSKKELLPPGVDDIMIQASQSKFPKYTEAKFRTEIGPWKFYGVHFGFNTFTAQAIQYKSEEGWEIQWESLILNNKYAEGFEVVKSFEGEVIQEVVGNKINHILIPMKVKNSVIKLDVKRTFSGKNMYVEAIIGKVGSDEKGTLYQYYVDDINVEHHIILNTEDLKEGATLHLRVCLRDGSNLLTFHNLTKGPIEVHNSKIYTAQVRGKNICITDVNLKEAAVVGFTWETLEEKGIEVDQ
ncbi:MAG: hypothetical protein WBG43_11880 [Marinifilaceae bacterium]